MLVLRRLFIAGLAAAALATAACSMTIDATALGVPATLAARGDAQPQGEPFRVTRHPVYLLWGVVPASEINVEEVLVGQVGTGVSLANVRVVARSRWLDVLITGLTAGLVVPRTVTIEGVVVPQSTR